MTSFRKGLTRTIPIIMLSLISLGEAKSEPRAGPIDVDVATEEQDYLVEFSTGERERHRAVYTARASFYMEERGKASPQDTRRCYFRSQRWVERRIDQVSRNGTITKGTPRTIMAAPVQERLGAKKNPVQYENCNDTLGLWDQWGVDIRNEARDMLPEAMQSDRHALQAAMKGNDSGAVARATN